MNGIVEHQVIAFSHFQSRKQATLRGFSNKGPVRTQNNINAL
jgi:hypothetical protein